MRIFCEGPERKVHKEDHGTSRIEGEITSGGSNGNKTITIIPTLRGTKEGLL